MRSYRQEVLEAEKHERENWETFPEKENSLPVAAVISHAQSPFPNDLALPVASVSSAHWGLFPVISECSGQAGLH